MLPLNILRGFNLIIDDDKNTFLEIEEMKLPVIGDETDDHSPGGSFMTIDVPLGIEKLEAAIKLRGMNPLVNGLIGEAPGKRRMFTAYQHIVDEEKGDEIQRIVTMRGRLSKADPMANKRKDMAGYDYTISNMALYEDIHDGAVIHRFNLFTNERTVNGVDINAGFNRNLAIR